MFWFRSILHFVSSRWKCVTHIAPSPTHAIQGSIEDWLQLQCVNVTGATFSNKVTRGQFQSL